MRDNDMPPSDFDWVTNRYHTTVSKAFDGLLDGARRNVARFNELRTADARTLDAYVQATVPEVFSVNRVIPGGRSPHSIRFIVEGDLIKVEGRAVNIEPFEALPVLSDKGQQRFKVGADLLDEWQLLRRALEPLFFGLKDWEI